MGSLSCILGMTSDDRGRISYEVSCSCCGTRHWLDPSSASCQAVPTIPLINADSKPILYREADDAAGSVAVPLALLRGVRAAGGGGGGRLVPPLPQRLLSRPQAGLRIHKKLQLKNFF